MTILVEDLELELHRKGANLMLRAGTKLPLQAMVASLKRKAGGSSSGGASQQPAAAPSAKLHQPAKHKKRNHSAVIS